MSTFLQSLKDRVARRPAACTLGVRPCPPPGAHALPGLGAPAFTPLSAEGWCYADPQLLCQEGQTWVLCRAWQPGPAAAAGPAGGVAAIPLQGGSFGAPQLVLPVEAGLAWPLCFGWNGQLWLLPSRADGALVLYRCIQFPHQWELVQPFTAKGPLANAMVQNIGPAGVTLLFSEGVVGKPGQWRWRRATLCQSEEDSALTLQLDDTFNLQNRDYAPHCRSAGPAFALDGQPVRPVRADNGVQFYIGRPGQPGPGSRETPLCALLPYNVAVTGVPARDVLGVDAYTRNETVEIIGFCHRA